MKKISAHIITLFLPFFIIAQDDYCPCMDKQNDVDEWSQFITELDKTIKEETQPSQLIFIEKEEPAKDRMSLPSDDIEIINKIDEEIEQYMYETTKTSIKSKKTTLKKRKKHYKVKLKPRKKVKKYRGKCPKF